MERMAEKASLKRRTYSRDLKDKKEPASKDLGEDGEGAQQVQRPWGECSWLDRATKMSPLRLERRVGGKWG